MPKRKAQRIEDQGWTLADTSPLQYLCQPEVCLQSSIEAPGLIITGIRSRTRDLFRKLDMDNFDLLPSDKRAS